MNISTPVDYVINLGWFGHDETLVAPDDGKRRLVVLRHGLWRSAGALWRLERALEDHGYEVLNRSYLSTSGYVEDHAKLLERDLEARWLEGGRPPDELYFVGHSMGGVQIRRYLSMPGARQPDACVFLATPNQGAILTDARKEWWLFKFFLGEEGARQLSPSDPLFGRLVMLRCPVGVVFGGAGDGEGANEDIPGDDDGTVGVEEAQLPEANDSVRLSLGHTGLSFRDPAVRQVLHYLRHRQFAR